MATDAEILYVQDFIGVAGTVDATRIGRLIDAANTMIDNRVGYKLTETADDYTEEYDGSGGDSLALLHAPINSIASLKIDGAGDWDITVAEEEADYTYDSEAGLLILRGAEFGSVRKSVQVVYNGGHSELPEDVLTARAMMVAAMRTQAAEGAQGIKSEKLGDRSVAWDGDMPGQAKSILDGYRSGNV